ncbi:hypothetical protein Bxe_B2859 [Paraburkholderia xenovorans LB400]|uniref:Uncharacterized protein n=1 Tax=Paraburkholderia xenovorans (strain LB400) TaxID=266265 RepID=Q13S03_PARXL|nr:hypothetical protein Bxe_B2859 [Paraburkholderia xenovorans LB400]
MVCERLRCRGFYSCCGRYLSNRQVTGYVFRNALACRFQLKGEWQAAVFSPCVPCHAGGFIRMSSARRSPARIEFMRARKTARAAPDQVWGRGIDATRERHHAGTVRQVENDSPSGVPMTDVPENNDAHHEVTHPAASLLLSSDSFSAARRAWVPGACAAAAPGRANAAGPMAEVVTDSTQ